VFAGLDRSRSIARSTALGVAQNRRQKILIREVLQFCRGLCVCLRGLEIIKVTKTPIIYDVSRSNFGGLGALCGWAKPTKAPPRGDGTGVALSLFG